MNVLNTAIDYFKFSASSYFCCTVFLSRKRSKSLSTRIIVKLAPDSEYLALIFLVHASNLLQLDSKSPKGYSGILLHLELKSLKNSFAII